MDASPQSPARTLPRIRAVLLAALLGPALAAGLTAVPVTAASAAAADADDVSWTVRTASNDFGAERTSYGYTVNPGSSVSDALVVANHGGTALDLGVYAADGFTTEDGRFDLVVGGAESSDVGAWTTADTDRITVGPGETVDVPFSVTVPENATPGDYAGGIVTSLVQQDDTNGIDVDRRLGIRIALRVGGDVVPALTVDDARLAWSGGILPFPGGEATMTYTVRNTGNAVLSARQHAAVAGPLGWLPTEAGAIDAPPQLLPGESWDVSVPVEGVPPTIWSTGTATVTPVMTDAAGSTSTLDPIVATAGGWAVPWLPLLLLVGLIALAVTVPRLRRRDRLRQQAREDARVQEAVDRALGGTGVPAASSR